MREEASGSGRPFPLDRGTVRPLLAAGVVLGVVGDVLLRAPGAVALNLFLWIAAVAVAAGVLQALSPTSALPDRARLWWLAIGVALAAGLAWRDAPPLKLLALGCATMSFAVAAYRPTVGWMRQAGILHFAAALVLGALHAWMAAALALIEGITRGPRPEAEPTPAWRHAAAVGRGLVIATPPVVVFGALFMAADAVFADLIDRFVRIDVELIASHLVLFALTAWLATGYLRGFLPGTAWLPRAIDAIDGIDTPMVARVRSRLTLGIVETATVLAALDLLFLAFVLVQARYLFGGDALVQVTPGLTYADHARRGFFELVVAATLVVPVLLAADWLLDQRRRRDVLLFRGLAGVQVALVLVIAASALERLRLYHATYGFTEARFYAMVLLVWVAAMLIWFAVTVLRGRRASFAFGALVAGLATVAGLIVMNPDAAIARANVARMRVTDGAVRFDVAHATTLSADAVPILVEALPTLPDAVRCPLARHLLRRWPPDHERSLRGWNWSAVRASETVRAHEAQLRAMSEPPAGCAAPDDPRRPRG